MNNPEKYLSKTDQKAIIDAITEAETRTSGEIKVHIEDAPLGKKEALERAKEVFYALKMEDTENKNAVLIYVNFDDHKLAIYAGEAIYAAVPDSYWQVIYETIKTHFKEKKYTKGLVDGILEIGERLKIYFPYQQKGDKNEISNDISFGNNV